MSATNTIRPEITVLTSKQQERVLEQVRRRRRTCHQCHGAKFLVGDALYLGFLFLSEDQDAYMAALTCANPACPAPCTGIRLHRSEFLDT
jgi:hypothetical protein